MTVEVMLRQAIDRLRRSGISSAIIDAEILLSFTLKKEHARFARSSCTNLQNPYENYKKIKNNASREYILTHPNNSVTMKQYNNFRRVINRRKNHEPIAYIVGEKEFYGLKFVVNKNVLIPRPETELIVDLVLQKLKTESRKLKTVLVDVGTGSGCIPIAIAKNPPQSPFFKGGKIPLNPPFLKGEIKGDLKILATDISKTALKIAKLNSKLNKVSNKITFLNGNLLEPFEKYSRTIRDSIREIVITANLPYIPTSEYKKLPINIKNFEPREALDGGTDGLKYYRQLFRQIKSAQSAGHLCPSALSRFTEHDPRQKNALKKLILKNFPSAKIKFHKDLAGKWRVIELQI